MGRRAKPAGEKSVYKLFTFPPELWAEFEAQVPAGERSRLLHQCVRRTLKRRQKQAQEEKAA